MVGDQTESVITARSRLTGFPGFVGICASIWVWSLGGDDVESVVESRKEKILQQGIRPSLAKLVQSVLSVHGLGYSGY